MVGEVSNNLAHYQYRTGAQQEPKPVSDLKGLDIEHTTGEGDDSHLTEQDDHCDQQEPTAENIGETPTTMRRTDQVAHEAAACAEITGVEQIPELHQHKRGKEDAPLITREMSFIFVTEKSNAFVG